MGCGDITLLDITNYKEKILKANREKCPLHTEGGKDKNYSRLLIRNYGSQKTTRAIATWIFGSDRQNK